MKPADLAYLSLIRRPASSLFAVASLGLALGLGGWLLNFYGSVYSGIEKREPGVDYLLGPKSNGLSILLDGFHLAGNNPDVIDYYLMKSLEEKIGPRFIVPLAHFAEYRGIPLVGTEDSFFQRPEDLNPPKLREGRWFNLGVEEAVLGSEAAHKTGLRPGETFLARSILSATGGVPVWGKKMHCVGILEPSGLPRDRGIYTGIRNAWDCHKVALALGILPSPVKRGRGVTCFMIGVDPAKPGQGEQLSETVHVAASAQVIDVEAEIAGLQTLLGQGRRALEGLTLLLAFLAISVAGLLFNERFETMKRELGILRALGYRRSAIGMAIVWEGFFLSTLGICLGMTIERLGNLVTPMVWNPPWLEAPTWPGATLIVLWTASLVASFAATALPLARLYRWNAHDALKGM